MATDQEIRDRGILYMPKQKYLQNPYNLPIAPVPPPASAGITNTNAFTNSGNGGGGGGALQVGDPMMNFDNYYNYTGNKYMQNQDTPNVDMTYDQKLQSNFMGMPSYRQQELTGADMGEYIGSNTDIPLEQTMAGKIQSGVQNTGKGIKNLMGMLPTPSNLLNKFGIQNFNSLSPADQLFIKTNSGYRGPTVFGENTGGGNVDPFGRNVESLMGNYAEKVRSDFDKLSTNLSADGVIGSKDQYQGATFDPVTGTFKADDEDDIDSVNKAAYANKMNKMNLARYRFDKKAIEQQKKNQRDIDAKNAAEAATAAAANRAGQIAAERGADTTTSSGGRGSRRGAADISESSRGGFATDDTASFFSRGGRVSFKNGGLASIL